MAETQRWALILGASSGFGAAASRELAKHKYHIAGVHLDRKGTQANVDQLIADIKKTGQVSDEAKKTLNQAMDEFRLAHKEFFA